MAVQPFDYEAKLAACAQENAEAFQELYTHESPHMLALCTKMLAQSIDAEEVVRDSFILIWKNADNYDPTVGTARAWMYSIMRYRVLNRLRQAGRPSPTNTEWTESLPNYISARDEAQPSLLVQKLKQIDDVQRRPILMAFYNGLTYDQIAARLATPVAQIKMHVRAGLRAIQELEQV